VRVHTVQLSAYKMSDGIVSKSAVITTTHAMSQCKCRVTPWRRGWVSDNVRIYFRYMAAIKSTIDAMSCEAKRAVYADEICKVRYYSSDDTVLTMHT
jgi:hypothetical protein